RERVLLMNDLPRTNHLAAVRLADRLMAEAHTKYRDRRAPTSYHRHRDPGLRGRTGPGRDDDSARRQRADILDVDFVVAAHHAVGAKLAQILDEIERERIVVVDDEYHAGGL